MIMTHCFTVELKKHRRMHMWLIPAGFLAVLFFWAMFSHKNTDAYDLAQGYTNLFFQLPMLNCILMPLMLSVIASRLCDMEIKGETLKLILTLEEKGCFYDLKFIHECMYLFAFVLGEGGIMLLCGRLYHYTETLSLSLLLRHLALTFLVGAVVLGLQHFLSLLSHNQILPLLTGFAGSFLGLFSLYFPPVVARLILWGYFGAFLPYGMNWDRAAKQTSYYPVAFPAVTFVCFVLFGILLYLLCRWIFIKKEV